MKTIVGVIIALVLVGGLGLVLANNDSPSPDSPASQSSTNSTADLTDTGNNDSAQPDEQPAQSGSVEISGSSYSPNKITVKKGATVTWTNLDNIEHDITPDDPSDEFKQSELLKRGESYSVTFSTAGTYTYFCTPHPFMKGTVEVVE
jgi:amicyanin